MAPRAELLATINVSYANFKYGSRSLDLNCAYYDSVGATVVDSMIGSQVSVNSCASANAISMQRNQIQLDSSDTNTAMNFYASIPTNVALSGSDKNIVTGTGITKVISVSGYPSNDDDVIPADSEWSVSGDSNAILQVANFRISGGVNLLAGLIVKVPIGSTGFKVKPSGELNVTGALTTPVIFTSSKDDSVGGDSNGDGASNGGVGDYTAAIATSGGSGVNDVSINLSYARLDYGARSLDINCNYNGATEVTIMDSAINAQFRGNGCTTGALLLKRNNFQLQSSDTHTAVDLVGSEASGIVLGGNDKNILSGSGLSVGVAVSGINNTNDKAVALGSTWEIAGDSGAIVIPDRAYTAGTINIGAGAIIKPVYNPYNQTNAFIVMPGANIHVDGTTADPVIFTSFKDDSAGGDTNGDGSSSGATSDFGNVFTMTDGSTAAVSAVNVSHAEFKYGQWSVYAVCNTSSDLAINIEDSIIGSPMTVSYCGSGVVALQRNNFNIVASSAGSALELNRTNPSAVILSGSNKNTFTGNGISRVVGVSGDGYAAVLPSGNTWSVDGDTNVVLRTDRLFVAGTLNLGPGVIVKTQNNMIGIVVKDGGHLNVTGTTTSPVMLTSFKDDSVGGDSNNDGSSTTPNHGDYNQSISSESGSGTSIDHASIKYGTTALNFFAAESTVSNTDISHVVLAAGIGGGKVKFQNVDISYNMADPAINVVYDAQVIYRGSFSNLTGKAIRACEWAGSGTPCRVDASYTDWGSSTGPFNPSSSTNDLVCGAVFISPWVYNNVEHDEDDVHGVQNCSGASTPSVAIANGASYFSGRVAARQIDCSGGFHDACVAIDNAYACLSGAMNVAQSTAPWPLPPSSTPSQVDALGGVIRESAATYMTSQALPSPTGFNLTFFNELISVTGTLITIGQAYNSCAP